MKERMLVIGYDGQTVTERKRGWTCGGIRPYYAESIMHSCIKRIRRRLETVSGSAAVIVNVRGVGYCYRE